MSVHQKISKAGAKSLSTWSGGQLCFFPKILSAVNTRFSSVIRGWCTYFSFFWVWSHHCLSTHLEFNPVSNRSGCFSWKTMGIEKWPAGSTVQEVPASRVSRDPVRLSTDELRENCGMFGFFFSPLREKNTQCLTFQTAVALLSFWQ